MSDSDVVHHDDPTQPSRPQGCGGSASEAVSRRVTQVLSSPIVAIITILLCTLSRGSQASSSCVAALHSCDTAAERSRSLGDAEAEYW